MLLLIAFVLPYSSLKDEYNYYFYRNDWDNEAFYGYNTSCYNYTRHVYLSEPDNNGEIKLIYDDDVKKIHRERSFKQDVDVSAIMENDTGVLIEQMEKYGFYTHLLRWQPETDTITKIIDIPKLWGKTGKVYYSSNGSVSGNYVILNSERSMIGQSEMCIVDMSQEKAKLLLTGNIDSDYFLAGFSVIKWGKDKAYCYYKDRKFIISLPSFQINVEKLPIAREIK
jgi:hypothetical protein